MIMLLAQPEKDIQQNESTVMGGKQKTMRRGLLLYVGVLCNILQTD